MSTNPVRESPLSRLFAQEQNLPSANPQTFDAKLLSEFEDFKKTRVQQRSSDDYEKRKQNGTAPQYKPVSQLDADKLNKKRIKGGQDTKMYNKIRRGLRKIAQDRGLASFARFGDATLPKLRQALYKTMSKEEVALLENEIKKTFKENPPSLKEPDENGIRKPGPSRNKDGAKKTETTRARAIACESSNRSYAKCNALYEEALKYNAMSPRSHYKSNINKLRTILRQHMGDDEIKKIEEDAVQKYDATIHNEKVPRKESRSASLLDQFFATNPDITPVSKVELLSDDDHRKYKLFLDEKDPERVERRHEANRQQEAKPTTYFIRIRNEAKKTGKPFNISIDDAKQLINDPCFYCKGQFKGLGIDAVDHLKGFVVDNIKACCTPCNKAKSDYSLQDFLRVMCNVAAKQLNVGDWVPMYKDEKSASYHMMRKRATQKERTWEISEDEFNNITSLPCNYCGFSEGRVGMDRKDNDVHYKIDNVLPCCCTCNRMKGRLKYDLFIQKAVMIYQAWGSKREFEACHM